MRLYVRHNFPTPVSTLPKAMKTGKFYDLPEKEILDCDVTCVTKDKYVLLVIL